MTPIGREREEGREGGLRTISACSTLGSVIHGHHHCVPPLSSPLSRPLPCPALSSCWGCHCPGFPASSVGRPRSDGGMITAGSAEITAAGIMEIMEIMGIITIIITITFRFLCIYTGPHCWIAMREFSLCILTHFEFNNNENLMEIVMEFNGINGI